MLKSRTIIILAAVLIGLVLISILQKASHRRATSRPNAEALLAEGIDPEAISRISVGYGQDAHALVLERSAEGWVVASAWNARANPQRIETLLSALGELSGEFRSDSAEVLADYGFMDSTRVTITGQGPGGDEVFSIEIGDKAQTSVGNFVKLPGNDAVYLSNKSVLSNLGLYGGPDRPQNKHFLDLLAYKIDRQEVEAVTLRDGDLVTALHKEFTVPEPAPDDTSGVIPAIDRNVYEWQITAPQRKAAAKSKVDAIQSTVTSLRASDVADPGPGLAAYGLEQPTNSVELSLQDGSTATLSFGATREASDERPAGIYLSISDDPTVWIVGEYVLNNIFKPYEDLLPKDD